MANPAKKEKKTVMEINMDNFFRRVLNVDVDFVRFLSDDTAIVTYKDKSKGVLKRDHYGWSWSEGVVLGCGDVAARDNL